MRGDLHGASSLSGDGKPPTVSDCHGAKSETKDRSDERRDPGRQLQHVCDHDNSGTS